jgi:hypothetical protein
MEAIEIELVLLRPVYSISQPVLSYLCSPLPPSH